ncbi:hypothetical protein A0128_06560 [Leptospira tipperaryensis]|uniref:Uncharacterized protein n=1 Tax=Leptospira tipperaryensis TaxID=2564040 RepID=A0A1D7UVB1_9LEPT|nr:hypothetical protein A0128_06560 [Leptospira tipperaryensis]
MRFILEFLHGSIVFSQIRGFLLIRVFRIYRALEALRSGFRIKMFKRESFERSVVFPIDLDAFCPKTISKTL